jgi:hypothetical protein
MRVAEMEQGTVGGKTQGIGELFRSLLVVDVFPDDQAARFAELQPGGIVVRRRFTESPGQVARLVARHRRQSRRPLLVAANFE